MATTLRRNSTTMSLSGLQYLADLSESKSLYKNSDAESSVLNSSMPLPYARRLSDTGLALQQVAQCLQHQESSTNDDSKLSSGGSQPASRRQSFNSNWQMESSGMRRSESQLSLTGLETIDSEMPMPEYTSVGMTMGPTTGLGLESYDTQYTYAAASREPLIRGSSGGFMSAVLQQEQPHEFMWKSIKQESTGSACSEQPQDDTPTETGARLVSQSSLHSINSSRANDSGDLATARAPAPPAPSGAASVQITAAAFKQKAEAKAQRKRPRSWSSPAGLSDTSFAPSATVRAPRRAAAAAATAKFEASHSAASGGYVEAVKQIVSSEEDEQEEAFDESLTADQREMQYKRARNRVHAKKSRRRKVGSLAICACCGARLSRSCGCTNLILHSAHDFV